MEAAKLGKNINVVVGRFFLTLVIAFIGFIRRHSNDETKKKIDDMVSDVIISNLVH